MKISIQILKNDFHSSLLVARIEKRSNITIRCVTAKVQYTIFCLKLPHNFCSGIIIIELDITYRKYRESKIAARGVGSNSFGYPEQEWCKSYFEWTQWSGVQYLFNRFAEITDKNSKPLQWNAWSGWIFEMLFSETDNNCRSTRPYLEPFVFEKFCVRLLKIQTVYPKNWTRMRIY